jgi:hypothetical protein
MRYVTGTLAILFLLVVVAFSLQNRESVSLAFLVYRTSGDDVERSQAPVASGESRPVHGVAESNLRFHVVQEGIHSGHREGRAVYLLAKN